MLLAGTVLKILLMLYFILNCNGQNLETNFSSYPNQGVCSSIPMIKNITGLMLLEDCSVIDGHLMIVLIEDDVDYSSYVFPNLREITEYLVLYRVAGIRSLGNMFPNLALIRGQVLFHNYALVIHSLPRLYELGLRSLTTILRGNVRINDNSQLCYSQTVNWELITGKSIGHNIVNNGGHACPRIEDCRGCDPKFCWNSKRCQKIPLTTCHPECLGGCKITSGNCYRCKHFTDNGVCVNKCVNGKIAHVSSHHCVTREACSKMYGGRGWDWNNECIRKCPAGYKEMGEKENRTCIACADKCNIVCKGFEINGYSDAQNLKGCNIIDGSLEIQFMDNSHEEDVMQELEESLGNIQEITGFLKVFRTPSITSFKFLKNLTTIHGKELLHKKYAIAVSEMPNLEHLWNTAQKITILSGTLLFHYNAKLCLDDITKLGIVSNTTYTADEVCNSSNGYAARCRRENMVVYSSDVTSRTANITWERIKQDYKPEFQMEYGIFYLEEPEMDVVTHNARDTCYSKEWNYISLSEVGDYPLSTHSVTLNNLQPYTKYAYYVETAYRNSSVPVNSYREGRSEIVYFVTKMERPLMPLDISAYSETSDTLTLYWNEDLSYRGTINHYLLEMIVEEDDKKILDERDYCISPIIREEMDQFRPPDNQSSADFMREMMHNKNCTCKQEFNRLIQGLISTDVANDPLDNCHLYKNKQALTDDDVIAKLKCHSIYFSVENDTSDHEIQKREVKKPFDIHKVIKSDYFPTSQRDNVTQDDVYYSYSVYFPGHHRNHTVKNLKYYTKYIITLSGCNGPNRDDCGNFGLYSHRTTYNKTADDISTFTLVVLNNTHVEIHWKEPAMPNGAVLSYSIEYTPNINVNNRSVTHCLTRKKHEINHGKYVLRIDPGEYGIRIRAHSLGMDGDYTNLFVFTSESSTLYGWLYAILGVIVISIAFGMTYYYWRSRTREFHIVDTSQIRGLRWTNTLDDDGRIDLLYDAPSE